MARDGAGRLVKPRLPMTGLDAAPQPRMRVALGSVVPIPKPASLKEIAERSKACSRGFQAPVPAAHTVVAERRLP